MLNPRVNDDKLVIHVGYAQIFMVRTWHGREWKASVVANWLGDYGPGV